MPEWLPLFAVVLTIIIILNWTVRSVTVMEYQRGLKYRKGRFVGVLDPGRYWTVSRSTNVVLADIRERVVTVGGQEVMSQDGVSLKISIAARYRLTDPNRALNEVENFAEMLYTEVQLQLREIVGSIPIDELLQRRPEIGQLLREASTGRADRIGVELLAVEIKDIMFPGDLKRVFTQVVQARQEGLAALERARGETAALRNLANTASLLERHPALLHLRTLQTLGSASGNTVVLALGEHALPPLSHTGREPLVDTATQPPTSL